MHIVHAKITRPCLKIANVSPEGKLIGEDIVSFVECDCGITGRAVANKVLEFFSSHEL